MNLPAKDKFLDPRYQDIRGGAVTLLTTQDGGALLRLIAGRLGDHQGPGDTHTPITMIHASVAPGARITLPWRDDFNALAYVLGGRGTAGPEGRPIADGQLAVFTGPGSVTLTAADTQESRHRGLDVLLLGGRPIKEPVAWYGPFVMNTRAELIQAFEDYQAGKLGVIPEGRVAHS